MGQRPTKRRRDPIGAVPTYFVLECPRCGARRAFPADEVSNDRLLRAVSAHLLESHPEIGGSEAEDLLERALEGPEAVETDEPLTDVGSWEPADRR